MRCFAPDYLVIAFKAILFDAECDFSGASAPKAFLRNVFTRRVGSKMMQQFASFILACEFT